MSERTTSVDDRSFTRDVARVVGSLRRGEVASYGEVAEAAGYPGAARAVGSVLSAVDGLPWWRVVRADGSLVSPNAKEQGRRLRREGVQVTDGRVVTAPGAASRGGRKRGR